MIFRMTAPFARSEPRRTVAAEPVPYAEELVAEDLDRVAGGIGSQSSGSGAGKITFNPFSIERR